MEIKTVEFAAILYRVLGTMPPEGEFCKTVKALADSDAKQDIQGYFKGAQEFTTFKEALEDVYGKEIELNEADDEWVKQAFS